VLILAISIAVLLGVLAGYFIASRRRVNDSTAPPAPQAPKAPASALPTSPAGSAAGDAFGAEKARIIRSLAIEAWSLRDDLATREAAPRELEQTQLERDELRTALAEARSETARYRQLVVDIENKAPPPILLGAAEPDDLKLIVGIGPVLERMLHNLGIGTFRQIAHWNERDVAEFDAKLPEFPGRIARDQWVTQARALHQSKYGERP
jgi:predicted flap endonuclease-1-like 5' DNA nuclease